MPVTVKPITERFGAEVSGVDLTKPLSDDDRRDLIAAQDKWGVTVHRNTGLNDETHIAFSRNFGYLERLPEGRGFNGHRELFSAGNLRDGEINRDPGAMTYRKGDQIFHTDSSFMDERTSYSLLLAYECPKEGGATRFADARSAYDDLPQDVKDRIEGLEADFTLWWSRKQGGADLSLEEIDARKKARHPIVHMHKGSGRKALYLGAHCYQIVGMSWDESRELIDYLNDHATQDKYVIDVYYKPGDMTIWDNLSSYHCGGPFDWNERRDMRRTTVRETVPEGVDDPFGDLFKEMPNIQPKATETA